MGIWAEIKHALNSTLGTDTFEPLDKIITSGYTLTPTDDVLRYLIQNHQASGEVIVKVKSNINGQLNVVGRYKGTAGTAEFGTVQIVVSNSNGIVLNSGPIKAYGGADLYTSEYERAMQIKKGEEYTFTFTVSSRASIYEAYLAGTTIGGRVFDEVIE